MSTYEDKGNESSIAFMFSNLREMDWIKAVICDASKVNNVYVYSLYPKDQEWLMKLTSPNIKIENIKFDKPKDIFKAVLRLTKVLGGTKLVIAHGFYSSLAAVIAGKLRFVERIATVRHHGTGQYNSLILKNLDRFISYNSTEVIAISELTKKLLMSEGVPNRKITVIPNAIDVDKFRSDSLNSREEYLKQFGLNDSHFVIGVISRFVEWKGINYTIDAFRGILKTSPNARLILANAHGKDSSLDELIATFEKNLIIKAADIQDMVSFYQCLNVFVHTPTSFDAEPSGLVYLESLASGINCVFTKSGVALELEELNNYAWLVDFKNSDGIEKAINSIIQGKRKETPTADYLSGFTVQTYVENFRLFLNATSVR